MTECKIQLNGVANEGKRMRRQNDPVMLTHSLVRYMSRTGTVKRMAFFDSSKRQCGWNFFFE
jgi:hypothetical protein